MKKTLLIITILFSNMAYAETVWVPNLTIDKLRIEEASTYIKTTIQPSNTCSNYGYYVTFNHTTESGKAFLSALLTAKASSTTVQLWYTSSTAPGTTHQNGCSGISISKLKIVAID